MSELSQILSRVQKPGRYIGEETNIVCKKPSKDKTKIALAYPDIYEIGMSYLGLRILYHLLNERDDIICERVFMPWIDMEQELKNHGKFLYSLETKTDINKFDIVGFSLTYELAYTNVLSMLQLGGITLFSEKRRLEEPLIIAGGASSYNPEPMSPFIDVFIIGDGEEALPLFIDEYKRVKDKAKNRRELLRFFSGLKGIYVPSLYKCEYFLPEGKFLSIKPLLEEAPAVILKNSVEDFENTYYPTKQIVPLIEVVHDRIAVEIMRGCPNKCRFCQAGTTGRPIRLRSIDRIRRICYETYSKTGYETLALLSFSSVNYPGLAKLVELLIKDFEDSPSGRGVAISVPSLRVDEAFYALPAMISMIRKTGLTFAPESGSSMIRKALGKELDFKVLSNSALLAFQNGWQRLKLYFMVGFPLQDVNEADDIVTLAQDLSNLKRTVASGSAEIKVSINPFVPKSHTPFERLGMEKKENLIKIKQDLISNSTRRIKLDFHNIDQSIIEACLSRGDRKIGDVIFTAWSKGARMDSWTDFFNFSIWENAFQEHGLDLASYACKTYGLNEPLPWSHIKTNVSEEYLTKELLASGLYK